MYRVYVLWQIPKKLHEIYRHTTGRDMLRERFYYHTKNAVKCAVCVPDIRCNDEMMFGRAFRIVFAFLYYETTTCI